MPFETIENLKPVAISSASPADGVQVSARKLAIPPKRGGHLARYIRILVGADLAKKLVWRGESERIDLAFGTDRDAGKIRASINHSGGQFVAKRDKQGRYSITINAATAEGLFALDFPAFSLPSLEPVVAMGTPPALVFKASDAMLAVD